MVSTEHHVVVRRNDGKSVWVERDYHQNLKELDIGSIKPNAV